MTRIRLLQAVCAVALLSAAPAFAQATHAQPSEDSAVSHTDTSARAPDMMSPGDRMESGGSNAAMRQHAAPHGGMMHGKTMHDGGDMSADSSADKLNEQSLQAARGGQASNGSGSSAMPMHGGSGSMTDMSGGSMEGGAPPAKTPNK